VYIDLQICVRLRKHRTKNAKNALGSLRSRCGYINQFPASQSTPACCIEHIALVLFFILVLFYSIITKEGHISGIVITQEEEDYEMVKSSAKSCRYAALAAQECGNTY